MQKDINQEVKLATSQAITRGELARSLIVLTLTRLIVNMGRRFPYPFLPKIARQLSVPLADVQAVMATQGGIGLASPLFGPLGERYGRKRVMIGALALMLAGSGVGALFPQFGVIAAMLLLLGVAMMLFDPALLAYIGDRVAYTRRGLAIGVVELSWAGSLVVSAPLAGFLLERYGLPAVFLMIGIGNLVALVAVVTLIPADHPGSTGAPVRRGLSPLTTWRIIRESPAALGALGFSVLLSGANEVFYINYGASMERSFGLDAATLGLVSIVIAAAEVIGELLVITVSDRLGKRRLTLIGAVGSAAMYALLPQLSFSLPATLVGLFVLFVGFEMSIVSSLPLFTEVLPNARSVMMSSNVAAHSIGRMGGALLGGALLAATGSVPFIGIVSLALGIGAFALLWWRVSEHHEKV